MHAISSYHGNRPTNIHTNPQTGPITLPQLALSVMIPKGMPYSIITLCYNKYTTKVIITKVDKKAINKQSIIMVQLLHLDSNIVWS